MKASRATKASSAIKAPPPASRPGRRVRPARTHRGPLRVGERPAVRFGSVNAEGDALARVNGATVAVPFAIPGESAVVEVTKAGRKAEGKLVQVLRKSSEAAPAACRHFGRCGGCQWQHIDVAHQRRLKTTLARDVLEGRAGVRPGLIADAIGGRAWAYRGTVRATVAMRDGGVIAGFHAHGGAAVMNVSQCPVQHPANEAMFAAVREMVTRLGLPVFDPTTGRGLVRGFSGIASFTTGEALLIVSLAGSAPNPSAIVHAIIDRVPGLVGILTRQQDAHQGPWVGGRTRLLWGRATIDEVIAGIRLPVSPNSDPAANPEAAGIVCDAVVRAAAMGPGTRASDLIASTPLYTLAMAAHTERALGVVTRRTDLRPFHEAAAQNGVANASFVVRRPRADGGTPRGDDAPAAAADVAVVAARGTGVEDDVVADVAAAGVPRVVSVSRTLGACVHDLARWRRVGYRVLHVQPVDVLPHTSHVHLVVTLALGGR
jgi:23S rRNA (uracil1939-C5)-methyltransferase